MYFVESSMVVLQWFICQSTFFNKYKQRNKSLWSSKVGFKYIPNTYVVLQDNLLSILIQSNTKTIQKIIYINDDKNSIYLNF